jgi:hypothetical protein
VLISQTAVLEKNTTLEGEFATEPFEVAWSREARWFFQVVGGASADVEVVTQVSPDGLNWVDLEGSTVRTGGRSLVSWCVREYGNWLRVRGTVAPGEATVVRIYLALKE